MDNITIMGESYPSHRLEPLAEFKIIPYRNDYFDGMEQTWL